MHTKLATECMLYAVRNGGKNRKKEKNLSHNWYKFWLYFRTPEITNGIFTHINLKILNSTTEQ